MISIIINYIKEKNKVIYSVLSIVIIIYFITINIGEFKKISSCLKETMIINSNRIPSFIIVVLFIVGLIYTFKISDKKSNKRMCEYLESQRTILKIVGDKRISVTMLQEYNYINGKNKNTIKAKITNESGETIKLMKGVLSFYYEKDKLKEIPMIVNNLYKDYSSIIYYKEVDMEIANWNHFDLYINSIIVNEEEYRNIVLSSPHIYRTYYFSLNINEFLDNRILGVNVKYNLVWLKKKVSKICSRIRFFCSRKTYKFGYKSRYEIFKYHLGSAIILLKRLLVYIILCCISIVIFYAFIDTIILFKEIIINLK